MVISYTDLMAATYSPAGANAWEEWDLTSRDVPGNVVVEILVEYPGQNLVDLEGRPGVREKDSALNRILILSPYTSTNHMATFRVNVDEDGVIEIQDNFRAFPTVPHCIFRPIGYFTGATYTETFIPLNGVDGVWEDNALFPAVPKGAVCDIMIANGEGGGAQDVGIREFGTAGFKYKMNECPYVFGYNGVYIWCLTDPTNGIVEYYTDDENNAYAYCMGYWDETVEYTVLNAALIPAGMNAWVNHNLVGHAVPKNAVPCIVAFNREQATVNLCGIREDAGAVWARFRIVDEGFNNIWAVCMSMCVRAITDNSVVELYTSDNNNAFLWLDGYLRSKYPVDKINGAAIVDIAKINGVDVNDIAGVNGYPIQP